MPHHTWSMGPWISCSASYISYFGMNKNKYPFFLSRRFKKASLDYQVAEKKSSTEELILNIKDRIPDNSLKVSEIELNFELI